MSDQDLIRRFLTRRDEQAFRELYGRHSPALYGLLRRLTGGATAEADDALQDAWMRAAVSLASFRGESAFRTCLTGIALNCLREGRRRALRGGGASASAAQEPRASGDARSLDVAEVLRALGAPHREVIVLHDIEGSTHEEIAAALGIEVGWAVAAAGAAALLVVWLNVPRPRPEVSSEPRFVLLLYAGDNAPAGPGRREEYAAWAREVAARGTPITGEELAPDDGDDTEPRGFFVIHAPDTAAARAIAAACPHVRDGGRVVVRRIVP